MESTDAFRLHAAGCTDTGEMLAEALPRIINTAAGTYRKQQQKQQQGGETGSRGTATDVPDLLVPLSWLPRSDRIKGDDSLLLQFTNAALSHAAAAATTAGGYDEQARGLEFVDWTAGALMPPADGLRYTDGCVFRLAAYPLILQATAAACGWAQLSPIPFLTLRFFREDWGRGRFLVTSREASTG